MNITPSLHQRFWTKVNKLDGCWIWSAATNTQGYGNIRINKKTFLSHRISWIMFNGEISHSTYVLHKCDNPLCVNPDHLYLGDQKQNMRDMINRGRHHSQSHKNYMPKGPNHHYWKNGPKISSEDAELIKNSTEKNYIVAKKYGVDPSLISKIRNSKCWNR